MTREEFNNLTGLDVSEASFGSINEMYLNAGDMNKEKFAKAYVQLCAGNDDALDLAHELSAVASRAEMMEAAKMEAEQQVERLIKQRDEAEEHIERINKSLMETRRRVKQLQDMVMKLGCSMLNDGMEAQALDIIGTQGCIAIKAKYHLPLDGVELSFVTEMMMAESSLRKLNETL